MGVISGIAVGVVSSFVYERSKKYVDEKARKYIPALFNKGNEEFLKAEDLEVELVVFKLRENYRKHPAIIRFLDDSVIVENPGIKMILDEIFLGEKFQSFKFDRLVRDFRDRKDNPPLSDGMIEKFTNEIRDSIKDALNQAPKTAPFVLRTAVSQIKCEIEALRKLVETEKSLDTSLFNKDVQSFTLEYLNRWKEHVRKTVIHGIDAVTKKERMRHELLDSFVPIALHENPENVSREDWRGEASEVIKDVKKIVIRGNAGAGKTTLLHWIILNTVNSDEITNKLTKIPIYIPLRRIEKSFGTGYSIEDAILDSMPSQTIRNKVPLNWVEGLRSVSERLIFMLDGLDEVREHNRKFVWELLSDTNEKFQDSSFILTSRNVSAIHLSDGSYRPDIYLNDDNFQEFRSFWRPPSDFFEFVVSPFKNTEVIDLIEKWFEGVDENVIVPALRPKIKLFPERLKTALFSPENIHLLELSRTPLLCALVCMVFFLRNVSLPNSRKELYRTATHLLIEARDEQRGVDVSPEFAEFNLEARLGILNKIAITMQEGATEGEQDQSIEVTKEKVLHWITGLLENDSRKWDFNETELLDFLVERCTIIREPVHNKIDFVHRSFMEFLAADQIVLHREPHAIRNTIFQDEWTNTLQFCMDTETGGVYFAGDLLNELYSAVSELRNGRQRQYIVKILSFLKFLDDIPHKFDTLIEQMLINVLPPQNYSEVEDLLGVPPRILNDALKFEKMSDQITDLQLELSVQLLSRHPSIETKNAILTGYHKLASQDLIQKIHHCGKIELHEHDALLARIRNTSYKGTVIIGADEFADQTIRKNVGREVGIRFPFTGSKFVGWDVLYKCTVVKLFDLTMADIRHMLDSVVTWRFDNCRKLEIHRGNGINFEGLSDLFPNVLEIDITRGMGISLKGIDTLENLENLWLVSMNQPIKVEAKHLPIKLSTIMLSNSTPPVVIGNLDNCELVVDDSESDRSLYVG